MPSTWGFGFQYEFEGATNIHSTVVLLIVGAVSVCVCGFVFRDFIWKIDMKKLIQIVFL